MIVSGSNKMSGYAADVQSVLRCGQCNKIFDKHSTAKRHLYYCRSRKIGNTSRPRSCIPCARGKTACDNARPQCSRCMTKSLHCYYPGNVSTSAAATGTHQRGDSVAMEPLIVTPAPSSVAESPRVDGAPESNDDGNIGLLGELDIVATDFSNVGDGHMEWDGANMTFADLFNTQPTEPYILSGSPSLALQLTNQTPATHLTSRQPQRPQQMFLSPQPSIPTTPTAAVRGLVRRPKTQPGAQRISNLILHTLKSYPLMILRHNTLPPFIHPMSADIEDPHMEPLTNCLSLARMITSGGQGSRKLFWKNVRLECERLSHEHKQLHKWGLLAAMQALSIYIIIRLDEGETDYNNFDSLLIKTIIAISQQLGHTDATCNKECGLCNKGLQLSWKEWIFRESRRRLAIIYRVVNMLIYFEPAGICNMPTEFILAPLPAKKMLWEAADEFSWKAESQKPGLQVSYGLAANGEIVELDESRLSCNDAWLFYQSTDANTSPRRRSSSWEEWCAGIDGLGGLVMLAASLMV
ncbi:hypothetical protein F4861DRAFT_507458 [Xylaria intraflava]|nr:hypothetical protein F4861DRAFT_507458 [Xylaria intraflava]